MSECGPIVNCEFLDCDLIDLSALLQHDERERQRSLYFVGHRHHRSLVDARNPRPDILTADYEHVVGAAEEMEKAVLIAAHISPERYQPSRITSAVLSGRLR